MALTPVEGSITVKNMQSATTNETLFRSNQKNMSPQKLPGFNLNEDRLGAKVNGSNIMMIQNFDPDHTDEPIDFERDLESNEEQSELEDLAQTNINNQNRILEGIAQSEQIRGQQSSQ